MLQTIMPNTRAYSRGAFKGPVCLLVLVVGAFLSSCECAAYQISTQTRNYDGYSVLRASVHNKRQLDAIISLVNNNCNNLDEVCTWKANCDTFARELSKLE